MKGPIEFKLSGDRVFSEREKAINQLHNKRYFGEVINGKLFLSLIEAAYLMERGKIKVLDGDKELSFEELFELGRKKTTSSISSTSFIRTCATGVMSSSRPLSSAPTSGFTGAEWTSTPSG